MEEAASFDDPAEELAWANRLEKSTPRALAEVARIARRAENRPLARQIRREVGQRDDLPAENKRSVLAELDAIPVDAGHLASAEVTLAVLDGAKDVEWMVREAVRGGMVNPVERLAWARERAALAERVTRWSLGESAEGESESEAPQKDASQDDPSEGKTEAAGGRI